jgi:hypothetical protein
MCSRLLVLAITASLLLHGASKKNVATAKGGNQDLTLTVTLHLDPADIKEMIGDDLAGHYIVAEVKVEPKYTKDIVLDRDDFQLRTDKDGEKTGPYSGSQIAGAGALIISQVSRNEGVASPGWTGTKVPVVTGGGAPRTKENEGDTSGAKPAAPPEEKAQDAEKEKENPLKKKLDAKILPEGKTDQPVSGLLYFPMEKQKMKDLELLYGPKEDRVRLRFKP